MMRLVSVAPNSANVKAQPFKAPLNSNVTLNPKNHLEANLDSLFHQEEALEEALAYVVVLVPIVALWK
jgi:hypothetical protein